VTPLLIDLGALLLMFGWWLAVCGRDEARQLKQDQERRPPYTPPLTPEEREWDELVRRCWKVSHDPEAAGARLMADIDAFEAKWRS
jgi:hypothetical protein